ncbi:MAG: hypothetical protein Q8941_12180 [Bacteroidota bacterium]|nr:hypothetical protein [Bacteroidota bacterium]
MAKIKPGIISISGKIDDKVVVTGAYKDAILKAVVKITEDFYQTVMIF